MICKNCGLIVFSISKQGVCKTCTTNGKVKEKKTYTRKEWKKFSIGIQEKLTEQYEITLTGKTTKEKVKGIFKRSDKDKRKERREKIGKVFKKIIKGSASKSGSDKMSKLARGLGGASGANHNLEGLLGKSSSNLDGLISRKKGVPKF